MLLWSMHNLRIWEYHQFNSWASKSQGIRLKCILSGILHYPSMELAGLHRECFRLDNEDID